MISLVIITYNEEDYLPKLLDCLLKQSYKDFEVIVVDSLSEDKTVGAAKKYSKKFKNYKLHILDKRKGPAYGRNTGGKLAKSNVIFFFDADNSFGKNFLKESIENFNKKNLDCATSYVKSPKKNPFDLFNYAVINVTLWMMQRIFPQALGSCIISKKKVFKAVKGFDESIKLGEDCNFVHKVSKKKYKFRIISPSYVYSDRRFIDDGRLKMGIRTVLSFFYRIFIGEIRTDIFRYRFGKHKKH